MSPALAILLFVGSAALTLGAAAYFGEKLDHIGPRLGLSETVVGLLTAAATDAPEVSSALIALVQGEKEVSLGVVVGSNIFNLTAMIGLSAVVVGVVSLGRGALILEGALGLLATLVAAGLIVGVLSPVLAIVLFAAGVVPYLVIVGRSSGREPLEKGRGKHVEENALWKPIALILPAVALIIVGATGMVRSALVLGDHWHIPKAIIGVLILAPITSLPDAFTAIRLAISHRGAAVVSETFGSNTINLAAGVLLPALIVGLAPGSGEVYFDLASLLVMTSLTILLLGRPGGMGRRGGALLIALYAVFVAVQVALA